MHARTEIIQKLEIQTGKGATQEGRKSSNTLALKPQFASAENSRIPDRNPDGTMGAEMLPFAVPDSKHKPHSSLAFKGTLQNCSCSKFTVGW